MQKNNLTPVEKALLIMETLSKSPFEFRSVDVCNLTGINKSTVHRILYKLIEKNWVIQDKETRKFKTGPMAYHVGMSYTLNNNSECKILEILNNLSAEMKESVGYAVRDGDKVISLYEIEVHQPYKLNYHPGQFYPMNRGSYGKCLMAYHDEAEVRKLLSGQKFEKLQPNTLTDPEDILKEYEKIRSQGYVISDEEMEPFFIGVGVPVFNRVKRQVEGCIAIAFIEVNPEKKSAKINEFLKILKEGAEEISQCLV